MARDAVPFRACRTSMVGSAFRALTPHGASRVSRRLSRDCAEGGRSESCRLKLRSDFDHVTGIIFHFKRFAEIWSRVDADTLGVASAVRTSWTRAGSPDAAFRVVDQLASRARDIRLRPAILRRSQRSSRSACQGADQLQLTTGFTSASSQPIFGRECGFPASTPPQTRSDIDRL